MIGVNMKITVFWNVTLCNLQIGTNVFEQPADSSSKVEETSSWKLKATGS